MKNLAILLTLTLGVLVSACSPRVTTSRPNSADLSDYSTFSYLPNAEINMDKTDFDTDEVNTRIIQMVNKEMKRAGYQLDRDRPDLLVLIETMTDRETRVDRDPVYTTGTYGAYYGNTYGVSPYYNNYYYNGYNTYSGVVGYDRDYESYQEGTLIISLIDRMDKNVVWRGATADAIYNGSTTDEMVDLVGNIFKEYPLNTAR